MRSWIAKFEAMAMAIAFAEQGEWQMAKSLLRRAVGRPTQRATDNTKRPEYRTRKRAVRL